MVGQDPARFRRSTTATRFPCEASDQAKNLALPLPSTTTSYPSGCATLFPLRLNSSRCCSVSYLTSQASLLTPHTGCPGGVEPTASTHRVACRPLPHEHHQTISDLTR